MFQCFGQTSTNRNIQFDFTQADSIIKSNLKILTNDSFFIVHQITNIGSYTFDKKLKEYINNPFQIIIYYKHEGEYYAIKINNNGISKNAKYKIKDLKAFIDSNFEEMHSEELSRKRDTILLKDGSIKISASKKDHQRYDQILINYKGKEINYYFPAEFEDNKWNLIKKRYLFLKLLQKHSEKLSIKLRTK